jgi:hypothetical protein
MSEPPDVDALARRFLDLWQEQLTIMAADPELADGLAKLLAGLSASAGLAPFLAGLAAAPAGPGIGEGSEPGEHGQCGRHTDRDAARAAAADAASRGGGLALDELARRLADVERRLARLEDAAGGGATARPRRRRA